MPTLSTLHSESTLPYLKPDEFMAQHRFEGLRVNPMDPRDRATLMEASQAFRDRVPVDASLDASMVRIGAYSFIEGRLVVNLKVYGFGEPFTFLIYRSSGENVGRTGKQAGEWYGFLGFHPSGWFVKTDILIELFRGDHRFFWELGQDIRRVNPLAFQEPPFSR